MISICLAMAGSEQPPSLNFTTAALTPTPSGTGQPRSAWVIWRSCESTMPGPWKP